MIRESKRADLVNRLADHVLAHGIAGASLRPLAAAVGTSDRMLLYYFEDKAALMATVLEEVAQRMTVLLDAHCGSTPLPRAQLEARLLGLLLGERAWPFMKLWLEIASLAAGGDPVFRTVGEAVGRGFLSWGAAQLSCPDEALRGSEAARLMMTIEGGVLLKSLGMEDVVAGVIGAD